MIYYKPDYEELGLEVPHTWADFVANCQALKDAGKTPVYFTGGETWATQVFFLGDFYNINAEDPTFAENYTLGTAKYATTPVATRSWEKYEDLVDFLNEDKSAATVQDGNSAIAWGEATHWFILTQQLPLILAEGVDDESDICVFGVPGDDPDNPGLTVWEPMSFYINKDSENIDAIHAFLDFYFSEESLDLYFGTYGANGPSYIKGYELPDSVCSAVRVDMQQYFDEGKNCPALEYISPIKGTTCEQLTTAVGLGRQMTDIVHRYGKKAYVFYDDTWIGLEPYGPFFQDIGFDGMIKYVFSGYEVRLCSGVQARTHEIRLHPNLFPVGLGGAPTFMEGGDLTKDAQEYWMRVRRALLRVPIERIGLGGYLHLTEGFPDFQDYIERIADEFRELAGLHAAGNPASTGIRVGVLHSWGALRPWTLSGHFHETYMHDLIHVNESLSGLPVDTRFLSFEDVKAGALEKVDVLISAGRAGDAWSGGAVFEDPALLTHIREWVYQGGTLLGINQPSAVSGGDTFYRLADLLGVDEDTGARVCHGRWSFETEDPDGLVAAGCSLPVRDGRFLTDAKAQVLLSHEGSPDLTRYSFGKGTSFYLSGYSYSPENSRLLLNLMAAGSKRKPEDLLFLSENPMVDCAYFPTSDALAIVNLTDREQKTRISTKDGSVEVLVPAGGQIIRSMGRQEG